MLFKATLNNISVISWWSVLLVEKITDLLQVIDKIYNRVTSQEEQFSSNLLPQFILNLTPSSQMNQNLVTEAPMEGSVLIFLKTE
jgi:hypothetical protein